MEKTYKLIFEFDCRDARENFIAYFLDGGGDGAGNMDINVNFEESIHNVKGKIPKYRINGGCDFIPEKFEDKSWKD